VRPDLHFNDELGDEPQSEWRGQIEQHLFRGAPPLNEVVFFHPATRTLILFFRRRSFDSEIYVGPSISSHTLCGST
jgi:hypothetical protein